jgi:hypothetical protein
MVRTLIILLISAICFAQPSNSGNVYTSKTNIFTKNQTISLSASNTSPGTTRHMSFLNTGGFTWLDYYFSNTLRGAFNFTSSGGSNFYTSGGNGFATYSCNSGLTSCSLSSYNTSGVFTHYGYGAFGAGVNAGATGTPSSTLENQGTLENKTALITESGTLTTVATNLLCDPSANSCTGSPTRACSYWTNSSDCGLRNSHGGCTWNAGNDCSEFSYESGMGSCSSTSGCTPSSLSCSDAGDQYTCESQDDSYGGSCVWNTSSINCDIYNSDQMSCESYSSYCTWSPAITSDCSSFNGDQTTCESYTGCTWDYNDSYTCSGSYETDPSYCSGTIESNFCDGTYYDGACSGSYGASCSGTPACAGISNSTNCGGETGCTWSTALSLILPSLTSANNGREYRIKNIASSGADCVITGNTGQDIDGASTKTLANYKDSTMLVYHELTASCSGLNEGSCSSYSGCTPYSPSCSWNSETNTCSGGDSCSGYSDESSCTSNSYYDSCQGTYISAKRWHEMAEAN